MNVDDGSLVARLTTKNATHVNSLAFNRNGTVLAVGSDNHAKLVDTAAWVELRRLEGHRGWVNAVAFDPAGTTLATASADQTVMLWDAELDYGQQEWGSRFFSPRAQLGFLWFLRPKGSEMEET